MPLSLGLENWLNMEGFEKVVHFFLKIFTIIFFSSVVKEKVDHFDYACVKACGLLPAHTL